AAPGASHDSRERYPPMKCNPGTSERILDEILAWLNDRNSNLHLMWLHGPAGTSAIAQSLAEMLSNDGLLAASFFFHQTSDTGRNDEKRLIATLAYQIAQNVPETRPHIGRIIANNPSIFDLSPERQLRLLIVDPLRHASDSPMPQESEPPVRPTKLIIIDSLDQC
ncbi:hypothetical protein B0H34DRAFT_619312, partial [Crassisporium funariophilum]